MWRSEVVRIISWERQAVSFTPSPFPWPLPLCLCIQANVPAVLGKWTSGNEVVQTDMWKTMEARGTGWYCATGRAHVSPRALVQWHERMCGTTICKLPITTGMWIRGYALLRSTSSYKSFLKFKQIPEYMFSFTGPISCDKMHKNSWSTS